jgi:hypothetical protein
MTKTQDDLTKFNQKMTLLSPQLLIRITLSIIIFDLRALSVRDAIKSNQLKPLLTYRSCLCLGNKPKVIDLTLSRLSVSKMTYLSAFKA